MAYWTAGTEGESVAKIQRYMAKMARIQGFSLPPGFSITGKYDANTVAAVKAWQRKNGLAQTGNWNQYAIKKSEDIARFMSKGKTSDPFAGGLGDQTISGDRKYVVDHFKLLYDRPPTQTELAYHVDRLQKGKSRDSWLAERERSNAGPAVTRIYKTTFGREPTPAELAHWTDLIQSGRQTRASMTAYLSNQLEGLEHAKEEALGEGAEDQQAYLKNLLESYGLGELSEWAWEQVKEGISDERIIQNLRETDAYKARFPGLEGRRAAGLSAISEADYIRYEGQAREIMRRAGFPPEFYDKPEDYAALISADISPDELESRVNDGYRRVMEAPIEVRQAFGEMYGADGDAALAALYVDPDQAEAALLKQTRSAETKGWGGLFGIDFSQSEAERVAEVDMDATQLREGLGQLQSSEALFTESVSEDTDLAASREGAEAVFGLGGDGATKLDERRRTRIAALAGGGGANISAKGLAVGAAD